MSSAPDSVDATACSSSTAPPLPPKSELERQWHERRQERAQVLKKVREEEKRALKASGAEASKQRIAYLMKQADIFTHFVKGSSAAEAAESEAKATAAAASSGEGRRGKGRLSEKAEDEALLRAATTGDAASASEGTRLTVQPPCIAFGKMRAYQLEGLNWLIKLHEQGINGILADEMGLGKTLQTISLLGYLKESRQIAGPHLIITPKSTLTNWANECARWCPSLKVFKLQGDRKSREALCEQYFEAADTFDVCLTTYETVLQEKAAIQKLVWKYLIIDEAHRIKNEQSKLATVVRLFHTHFRLLITGTPLQNDLHELWAMLNFLLPDVFGEAATFDAWFDIDKAREAGGDAVDLLTQLHKILRPFLLRRLKADVEKDLPPKREIKLLIGLSDMQRKWYANILEKNIDVLNAMGANKTRMLNMLMQLRKCANHPYLFEGAETPPFTNDERLIRASGKMALLDKLLVRLHAGDHRVLLFSQMTRMLDILEDYCAYRGWVHCRIDGSTSGDSRDEQMNAFNAPGSPLFLFLLSTRAGGLGINLATADTVILFDSDWNPQMDLQAMDRAHRIGQTKPVAVYRFCTEGTVEEKMIERAQRKLYLDAAVIQQGRLAEQTKALTKDELLSMVRFGADAVFKAAAGADPSEADLDALLQRGEEASRTDSERLKASGNSLANFTLGSEEKSLYEYEGQDYKSKEAKGKGKDAWVLSLPKRVTKANYDENAYYRNALDNGKAVDARGAPKPPRQVQLADFQFFNLARLEVLRQKEWKHYEYRKAHFEKRHVADAGPLDEREMKRVAPPLSVEELEEKELLMSEGFTGWTKRDVLAFVHGCELFGRDDLPSVASEVEGKTIKEVARYAVAFFKRVDEIKDGAKYMRRICEGEAQLARAAELDEALGRKIRATRNPWLALKVDWGGPRPFSGFSLEADRFLLCMSYQLGYGKWEELQKKVRQAWSLKFDWWLRTRTQAELGARVEQLAKLVEAELLQSAAQRKGAVTGAKGATPSAAPAAGTKRPLDEEPPTSRKR